MVEGKRQTQRQHLRESIVSNDASPSHYTCICQYHHHRDYIWQLERQRQLFFQYLSRTHRPLSLLRQAWPLQEQLPSAPGPTQLIDVSSAPYTSGKSTAYSRSPWGFGIRAPIVLCFLIHKLVMRRVQMLHLISARLVSICGSLL